MWMGTIKFAAILFCASLLGCSDGFLEDLGRALDDPVILDPRVVSFVDETKIYVSWDEDPGADEYLLERAQDTDAAVYGTVYRGTDTTYTDTDCVDQDRFLYRLRKLRGNRSFGPSAAWLGVCGAFRKDAHEPNDTEDAATALSYDRISNLYFYRSYTGEVLGDVDWYRVAVPARRVAYIMVIQDGIDVGTENTKFEVTQPGLAPARVKNSVPIEIRNTTYVDQDYSFKIHPHIDDFFSSPEYGGGSMVSYTIMIYSIGQLN